MQFKLDEIVRCNANISQYTQPNLVKGKMYRVIKVGYDHIDVQGLSDEEPTKHWFPRRFEKI